MNKLQSKLYLKTASPLTHSLTSVSFLENTLIETRAYFNLISYTDIYSKDCTKHLFAAKNRFI